MHCIKSFTAFAYPSIWQSLSTDERAQAHFLGKVNKSSASTFSFFTKAIVSSIHPPCPCLATLLCFISDIPASQKGTWFS